MEIEALLPALIERLENNADYLDRRFLGGHFAIRRQNLRKFGWDFAAAAFQLSTIDRERNELREQLERAERREAALRELAAKWADSADWEYNNGDRGFASGLDQCASDLGAALASPAPPQP